MMKNCVLLNGNLENVGEWNYDIRSVEVTPAVKDEDGNIAAEAVYEDQTFNPLPEGATTEQREVIQNADGGWVLAIDYAALRRAEYPDYNPFDILDEILKHVTPDVGSKLEQIITERNAVKVKYPKPL